MDAVKISAEDRSSFGKGSARKLRASGKIPAVVYRGGADAHHVSIDPSELEAVFRKSNNRNTLLAIEAGGSNHTCLVKEVQRHPLTQKIVHLDLFEVDAAEDVRVEVNIVPVGTAVGVKMGIYRSERRRRAVADVALQRHRVRLAARRDSEAAVRVAEEEVCPAGGIDKQAGGAEPA